jgi:hypothetical protein
VFADSAQHPLLLPISQLTVWPVKIRTTKVGPS